MTQTSSPDQSTQKISPIQVFLMGLLLIILGLLLFGPSKKPKSAQIPDNLQALVTALKDHYKHYPIGGGWKVINVDPTATVVHLEFWSPANKPCA